MITTGAEPERAIMMSAIKNDFGKSVTAGLGMAVQAAFSPSEERMQNAASRAYIHSIQNMVSRKCHQEQGKVQHEEK